VYDAEATTPGGNFWIALCSAYIPEVTTPGGNVWITLCSAYVSEVTVPGGHRYPFRGLLNVLRLVGLRFLCFSGKHQHERLTAGWIEVSLVFGETSA
jgi:hypothetical protein